MKLLKLMVVLACSAFLFSACEKCVTCSYAAPGYKPYSGSYCSKRSKDIDSFKKNVSDEAQRFGTSAECIDKDN